MAPRSPTHAFDPTPALEQNKHNFSPFNQSAMISVDHFPMASKEVRFASPPLNSFTRAHSIATENVPLLPQIQSASAMPRQAVRFSNPGPGIDINAYIENCRNLNEQLRQAHETERRTWEIERAAMKEKIADLEFQLRKTKDVKRRSSIESSSSHRNPSVTTALKDFRANYAPNGGGSAHALSENNVPSVAVASPVWKPEITTPTTRVFSSEDGAHHHLPSISEDDAFPTLSKQVSPTAAAPVESVPVPIEQVEPTLDGIMVKSAALTSSFSAKITSPQFGTPSRSPTLKPAAETNKMQLDTHSLLAPLDEKLRRHAGHTPMNFEGADPSAGPSDLPTEVPTPQAEKPAAPVPTARPPLRPSENSNSYFSFTSDVNPEEESKKEEAVDEDPNFEPENDKPLRGPLMLDPSHRSRAADAFLSSVDAKLMEAVKEVSPTRRESILSESGEAVQVPAAALQSVHGKEEDQRPAKETEDDMPRLRLKKSSNFGSAYGSSMPGWR